MKIMSPLSKASEVEPLLAAGADELYCGVLSSAWRKDYTNMASVNRREWSVSNLTTMEQLEEVVHKAHAHGGKVNLTLNALYTEPQYPLLLKQLEALRRIPLDAVIVADLGLLLTLRQLHWEIPVHISTGATVFNVSAAKFFKALGGVRVIFPRQNTVAELLDLARKVDFMETEVFIFNSGCKNIDGFCTFQHGSNEILKGKLWKIPKALGLDYKILKALRRCPPACARAVTRSFNFMPDSACLLNYQVEVAQGREEPLASRAASWIASTFNFFTGLDTCGACSLYHFKPAGITAVKIVGRENPTAKKLQDVKFLKSCLNYLDSQPSWESYQAFAREEYQRIFKTSCHNWCYYPETSAATSG